MKGTSMAEPPTPTEEVAWLTGPAGQAAIAEAFALPDTEAPSAVERMRKRHGPHAAAALTQAELRHRARAKFGEEADALLLTRAGLEQATRPAVALHRARVLATAGARRVLDLGCGLGTDTAAFVELGMEVVAVELDPTTAAYAAANLAPAIATGQVRVLQGDAVELLDRLWSPGTAAYADPARRTGAGRSWNPADFTPSWDWALALLERAAEDGGVGCLKLGPGLPYRMIPESVGAEWVSHRGDLVEVALWRGEGGAALPAPGSRTATLLADDGSLQQLVAEDRATPVRMPEVGTVLWEPDAAVIRAGAVDRLAAALGAGRVAPDIAYLVSDDVAPTPFATVFRVLEVLPTKERVLREWVRDREVGRLEIKKRGIDVDPAALRRKLRPAGPNAATLVLTPTPAGARALVVQRAANLVPSPPVAG
ncbi:Methyltransferase domain-containing protein [Raineyella antarctica]|uniref:Methyltransferase domain-containing protein n=1 Tax=Raineyella antarctica TaxID=1577474 RepID=A0A1G6I5E4_9ACTN|nr:class I SAM-dependent methyltransferase [Raineyella antarctica]SDC00976.1 Methyltransferase domain-containing protein [Raineyella antarctica]